ncbi:MAG: response regulator [Thermodesulfobacteriota bacterium]|nr:response regulator [Thermodesulfobacteriota bacterium]
MKRILNLGSLSIILLVWVVCICNLLSIRGTWEVSSDLEENIIPEIIAIAELDGLAKKITHATVEYILTGDVNAKIEVQRASEYLKKSLKGFKEQKITIGLKERKDSEQLVQYGKELIFLADRIVKLNDKEVPKEALTQKENVELHGVLKTLVTYLMDYKAEQMEELTRSELEIHQRYSSHIRYTIIIGLVATLLTLLIRIFGGRLLLRFVTDYKEAYTKMEEARKDAELAKATKNEFLANMSHEIRTPMNSVIGFADMLLESNLDEDQIEYATAVKRSGELLLSLINDILDFSKIETGDLDFEDIEFDPELLAYDVCNAIRPRIGTKPIEILCRIGENLPSSVIGDPGRFRQVLINLMGNASKFTDSGEIELSLDAKDEKDNRIKIHATVRDTGIGIPKEKMDTILKPFLQVDGSTTRKYGGTGLGLSICKKIAILMRGEIWFESEINKGSLFNFTAWLGKAQYKEVKRHSPVSLCGKKALILDDNQNNLDILAHSLKAIRMRIVALKKGEDFIPTLQNALDAKDPFDIGIVDIQMPGISGYEIARQVRNASYHFRNVPLIALSSLMERDARRCQEAGFNGFLVKPTHREKLYQIIERLLWKSKDRREEQEPADEKIMTQYSVREQMKYSVRILLAEDNLDNQLLAKRILIKAGYQVEVANNGLEVVERFTTSPGDFDLIFMDVQMPEMDGIAATKAIRSKGFETIPIIALTAHTYKVDIDKCFEAGMDDYISKPIKRELVFKVIKKWVIEGKEKNQ